MLSIVFFVYDDETGKTVPVPVDETEFDNQEELEFIYDDAVRKVWHAQQEEWYFSIVDVCQVLADLQDYQHARNYWKVLKNRLLKEGNEPVTNCNQFKLKASDGKMRLTDCANTEQLLRIIQSIPSKKAEPFKQWLALVGKTVQQYKQLKGLHKENLRDNMTNTELVLNQLAEISATELAKNSNPKGYSQAQDVTIQGGEIARGAREALEKQLGRSVLSPLNAKTPNLLDDKNSL